MPKKLIVYAVLVIVWAAFLWVTHLRIFPCLEFISDSTQGDYPAFCALIDEDGYFLLTSEPGYYDPTPTVWTWVGGFVILFVLPYLAAIPIARKLFKHP